jgi:hypothetical protein
MEIPVLALSDARSELPSTKKINLAQEDDPV